MATDLPPDWHQMSERPVAGGRIVLAERMRPADLGIKRVLVEQYATWFVGADGPVRQHTFDTRDAAVEDYEQRR